MKTFSYLSLEDVGRLGNQLFEIAWVVGQAEKFSGKPAIPTRWSYREFFSLPDDYYQDVTDGDGAIDGGREFFQEYQYFSHCKDLIKQIFSPSKAAQEILNTYPGWLLDPDVHKTSIHMRRTDYLANPQHYVRMTPSYYDNAMALARARNPETKFVVFSDDYEYATSFFRGHYVVQGDTVSAVPSQRPEVPMDWVDLFLQRQCQGHIIANSTYSWWGAFLSNDAHPIYPSQWYGPKLRHIDWKAMIPPFWTEVQV